MHRVAFFGGQGSRTVFASETSATAIRQSKSHTGGRLLSTCYDAFAQELSDARNHEKRQNSLLLELTELTTPESLLSPPATHQTNPIIQGISLLLQQVLSYCHSAEMSNIQPHSLQEPASEWDEVVGFCSGVLPALVLATSRSIEDLIQGSEHAVRLAFWIGYRVALLCEERAGAQWRASPWSVAVSGLKEEDVTQFNSEHANDMVCFSARISPCIATITGSPASLDKFMASSQSSGDRVPVHGWYHGGDATESVAQAVLQDVGRRSISFPAREALHIPLRSPVNGRLITEPGQTTLAETAVRTILTHSLDWQKTWETLSADAKTEIHVFGPHSRSFFSARSRDTKVVDHSSLDAPKPQADIAIVGMSVNFPSAKDKESLWQTLEQGINTVQTIPETRFKLSEPAPNSQEKSAPRPKYGNFVDSPWAFDHAFFDISPREARSMDPQQKMLLHSALHALDDAGYVPDATPSFQRSSMGCYVGIATGDYVDNLRDAIDVYYSTGTLRAFLSGRLSYSFKFSGPSMVLDTACSASSVALYNACQALSNGDCSAALAGGANAITSPDMFTGLGRAHFLSPTGQCKSFDAGADGYCRAEGCGVFVLKRLSDALRENDRVYGVIRGIAVNQSANASSITRPHSETQASLFRTVLGRAAVDPASIDVVEAHGTGTQAGDGVEISSIQSVFHQSARHRRNPLFVTSIKGNIGHAEAASGAASLAKVLLMLKNGKVPPQTGLQKINPRLGDALSTSNMRITTEGAAWEAPGDAQPRRAMINNFGAAGSNVAMIVEEAPVRESRAVERSAYPFVVSARTVKALDELVREYRRCIAPGSGLKLADICYTATARRRRYEHMVRVSCCSVDELLDKLTEPVVSRGPSKRPLIMVFSGQGGAYPAMGRELLETSPFYQACVYRCERLLGEMGFPSIRGLLTGDVKETSDTYLSQTASFVLQYALACLWKSWGVEPDAIIGHSLGEYAAMVLAGVMSLADGLRLVATRATLIAAGCAAAQTGMMACNQSDQEMLRLFAKHENLSRLEIACQNTQQDSVVAGPIPELQALAALCKQSGVRCKILDVPYGFHSSAMDPILAELRQTTASTTYYTPKVRLGSTVYGAFVPSIDAEYFVRQSSGTVRFAELLDAVIAEQDLSSGVFLEIGPSPITLPMIRKAVPEGYGFIGSLSSKMGAWEGLSSAAVELSSSSDINWRSVFDGSDARLVDGPAYPLEQEEHFIPYKETQVEKATGESSKSSDEVLAAGLLSTRPEGQDNVFETPVQHLAPYIQGHIVGGVALCPASIYHEMAIEGASLQGIQPGHTVTITDLTFDSPLVYTTSPDHRTVQLRIDNGSFHFLTSSPAGQTVHCSGTLLPESIAKTTATFTRKAAMIQRQLAHLKLQREQFDTFHTSILYETIFPRVVRYAENYRSIRKLTVADSGLEGFGNFKLPAVDQQCVLSPAFVDTLLHGVGFMANNYAASSDVYICNKVESARVLFHEINQTESFSMYCSLLNCDEGVLIADAYAITPGGKLVAAIEGIHFKKLNLRAFHRHLSRYEAPPAAIQVDADSTSTTDSSSDGDLSSTESAITTPDASGDEAVQVAPAVTSIITSVCGVDRGKLTPSASLAELGIDSLMAIEITAELQRPFPAIHLDSSTIMETQTVGDLTRHIEKLNGISEVQPVRRRRTSSRKGQTQARNKSKESARASITPTHKQVNAVLADVCGCPEFTLREDQPLSAYGIDSLLVMEVQQTFKQRFGVTLSAEQLVGDITVNQLGDLVTGMQKPRPSLRNRNRSSPQSAIRPILLQPGDEKTIPLVLIHDGSGSVAPYSKLKAVPFPLYGIASPISTPEGSKITTLKQMAMFYADAIRSTFDGPVALGGWSFGGVLAYEITQQLKSQVAGVILIDSPSPINHQPLPRSVIQHILQDLGLDTGSTRTGLMAQFTAHAAMLGEYSPAKDDSETEFVMLQSEETLDTTRLCSVSYPWLESKTAQREAVAQWRSLVDGEIRVLPIPGNHFEPFKVQNVARVTERLVEAYSYVV
ncbi:hypothetical protein BDW62DRAFT_203307 [Aspergillus aurantiobrunneus]